MNPEQLARDFKKRANGLSKAISTGLRNAAIKVDNEQVNNLRGGSAPGDYPIPVRSGNLLGSHFFKIKNSVTALVGNTASYALAIHDGKGRHEVYGRRPFLDDAVEAVDVQGEVRKETSKVVLAL